MKQLPSIQIKSILRLSTITALIALLAACGGTTVRDSGPQGPVDLSSVRDAVPKYERQVRAGNPNTYVIFGVRYYVKKNNGRYQKRGIASWYGRKFHGRKTSNGETYNMYAMTAAHKTLRIPAYVKVNNLENGKSIIVRVNDRGPFVNNRIIDLSYAAAHKLGIAQKGTGLVEVSIIKPGETDLPVLAKKSSPKTLANETTQWQHHDVLVATRTDNNANAKPAENPDPDSFGVVSQGRPPKTGSASRSSANKKSAGIKAKVPSPTYRRTREKPATKFVGRHKVYLQIGAFFSQANAQKLINRTRKLTKTTARIFRSSKNNRTLYRVRVGPITNVKRIDQLASLLDGHGIRNTRVVVD